MAVVRVVTLLLLRVLPRPCQVVNERLLTPRGRRLMLLLAAAVYVWQSISGEKLSSMIREPTGTVLIELTVIIGFLLLLKVWSALDPKIWIMPMKSC